MSRAFKILPVAAALLIFIFFGVRASAAETEEYSIRYDGKEYVLSYEGEICRSELLGELFDGSLIPAGKRVVLYDIVSETGIIQNTDGLRISGSMKLVNCDITVTENTVFEALKLDISENASIRIKQGELTVKGTDITAGDKSAVVLDYSSEASLAFESGSIRGAAESALIRQKYGTVKISGGEVNNTKGSAVSTESTLYLTGDANIKGKDFDVVTNSPVTLSHNGLAFSGTVKVKYDAVFEKGDMKSVFYGAVSESINKVELYDKNNVRQSLTFFDKTDVSDEKNFLAVYLPFEINFYSEDVLLKRTYALKGETVSNFEPESPLGYKFVSWHRGDISGDMFEFDKGIFADENIYARFELLPPEFVISSIDKYYDGTTALLSFAKISHPLLEKGVLSFAWFYNGEFISSASSIDIKGVSNSGTYLCKLTFTIDGKSASVETPSLSVTVRKALIKIPAVLPSEYTGEHQYPDIPTDGLFDVISDGGINAGEYPVRILLRDAENYCFEGRDEAYADLKFKIIKANNSWVVPPTAHSVFEGEIPVCDAVSKFGEMKILYSDRYDGEYGDSVPESIGEYYMRVSVTECDNYTGLLSEPLSFNVKEEIAVGIYVDILPKRLSYLAFEEVSLEGISAVVTYNSGRKSKIGASDIFVRYQDGASLKYGDSAVILSFEEAKTPLEITVEKAEYDISDILFSGTSFVYDGNFKSLMYQGSLPQGKDGIPLLAEISGSALNVGTYSFTMSFKSESKNYKLPAPLYATLEILPRETNAIWENASFVYDGNLKVPTAYFHDINGIKKILTVDGAKSYAGSYTATVNELFENYKILNSSFDFLINKADYNMNEVTWSIGEFIYDGSEKSVLLNGLPDGVSVIGYVNGKAVNAGVYRASASFSYDSLNYNPPTVPEFVWQIRKAEYPLGGFYFENSTWIYDGKMHYPRLAGVLPTGADGIKLEYSFDKGALHVSDGEVIVIISFKTDSVNYRTPPSVSASVKITPLGISVVWGEDSFVYSGEPQAPVAVSELCEISVTGAEENAGSYTAVARSLNSDYYIINSSCAFTIERAVNGWVVFPSLGALYDGEFPSPDAEAYGGSVKYKYFRDESLNEEISAPHEVGVYYFVAETDGGLNHHPIKCAPVRFEIQELIAKSLEIQVLKARFEAFEKISDGDFSVFVTYNSGRIEKLPFQALSFKYKNGDSLRAGQDYVTVSALGVEYSLPIYVEKTDYDISGVVWGQGIFVYDGSMKSIYITGLPEGVGVLEYIGNGIKDAGEYSVYAVVEYDEENYNAPQLPAGHIKINKKKIKAPEIAPLVYTGKFMSPLIENSEFYNYSKKLYRDGGIYSVEFRVTDERNYEFLESASSSVLVDFQILPLTVGVKIEDVTLYRDEKFKEPYYILLDTPPEGDDLMLRFVYEGDSVYCISESPNYTVRAEAGKIIRSESFSPEFKTRIFLFLLLLLLLTALILILVYKRDSIKRFVCVYRMRKDPPRIKYIAPPLIETEIVSEPIEEPEETAEDAPRDESRETVENEEISLESDDAEIPIIYSESLTEERAKLMISDSIAKTLIHKNGETVESFGSKKRIINVDTLSANFSAGDTVDINLMKSKRLIPYDTGYIKVLARGIIDKPLRVYANDFSLSAVKMIALLGGEAIKVKTVKVKLPRNPDE